MVVVWVRTSATVTRDGYALSSYTVAAPRASTPATQVSLTGSPLSTASVGTPVTFTAVGSGSTTGGAPTAESGYDYQFFVSSDGGATWSTAQPYGSGATFVWTPNAAGSYMVVVWVRTSATVTRDGYAVSSYTVN
jgi:hypothetical protein